MTPDWTPLRRTLAACRRDNVAVPLWWRDDDAIAPTRALDQLAALSDRVGLPVHLAVVPAHADTALPAMASAGHFIPVVHGWTHTDHSGPNEKKNEFQTPRPGAMAETSAAMARMTDLFGAQMRSMFVPPWNRISADVTAVLAQHGYSAVSTFGPRHDAFAAPGLAQINTHIDPIWWKGTRDLVDPDQLIAQAAAHLEARRLGAEDAHEPLGLLTHHLVHTNAIWEFSGRFIDEMRTGGATPWSMETET